jgi:hypothetical protein
MHHGFLHTVLYRYEGSTKQGDRDIARFTVLVPEKSLPQSSQTSSQEQTGRNDQATQAGRGGQELSDQALAQAGWKRVGETSYFTKDGLLENCNINFMGPTGSFSGADQGTTGAGKNMSLVIRRVHLDGK